MLVDTLSLSSSREFWRNQNPSYDDEKGEAQKGRAIQKLTQLSRADSKPCTPTLGNKSVAVNKQLSGKKSFRDDSPCPPSKV